jgi:lipopolysaccharide export system protein LptA
MIKCFKHHSAAPQPLLPSTTHASLFAAALLLALCFVINAADAKKIPKNVPLILQSANSNENTYVNGEFISYLKGNVKFMYDDITIHSDEATWWRNEGRVHFQNNVKVTQKAQLLTCDRMDFTKETNQIDANGHFFYRDTTQLTELKGDNATYLIEKKVFTLVGSPKLLRFDTTAAETLTIIGKKVTYVDTLKLATVFDDVVITKGKLTSRCQKAQYQTEKDRAYLRIKPFVTYDINEIVGDSIDLQFGDESLRSASIFGNAHGVYFDTSGKSNDTAFTHVWGDTLYMSLSDSGSLDSIWVHGKAISKNFTALKKYAVNQANGKTMLLSFGNDGNVDKVKIWGNARSTYYMEEDDSRGINESSGDSIMVAFNKGKAVFLNLTGSARGKFFPNDL